MRQQFNMQVPLILLVCLILFLPIYVFADSKKVFISKIVDHPALDATVIGIVDALESCGYKESKKNLVLKIESAQGNTVLASQIAANFASNRPDVMVGVGTVAAQSMTRYSKEYEIPLVFSSVTDPLSAGLINQNGLHNVSGVSNFLDLRPQILFFKKIKPQLKRIGMLYNPSEVNAVWVVDQMRVIADDMGIELIVKAVIKTSEIAQNAIKLATKVDAFFVSNDNTVLSALRNLIRIARKNMVPVYLSDIDAMGTGSLAALGPDQHSIGIQTGEMICNILQGSKIDNARVEYPKKQQLIIDLRVAKALGIEISEEVMKSADSTMVFEG